MKSSHKHMDHINYKKDYLMHKIVKSNKDKTVLC